jgi:hypothetical protein
MPLPPRASLEGIPRELRDEIYHLVDISTPVRVVSAAKLVTAYQESQFEGPTAHEWQRFLERGLDYSNVRSPIVDLSTLLNLSTALHPLCRASRQFYAEYHPQHVQTDVSRYRFMVYNFNITQIALASVAIKTLGIDEWRDGTFKKQPHGIPRYGVYFIADDGVVSSIRALCETILDTNTYPPGLAYINNMGWHLHVRNTMKQEQTREILKMVGAMSRQTSKGGQRFLLGTLRGWIAFLKCEAFTGLS